MKDLYHLSNVKGINILKKQIPQKIPGWDWSKEDTSIERVCFSTSIDGCFSAICPIIGEKMYVYSPLNYIPFELLRIPTVEQVFDSKDTNEIWALQNILVKCIGIVVADDFSVTKKENYIKRYNYFQYKWHWVEKF